MYLGSPKIQTENPGSTHRLPAPCCPKRNPGPGQCLKANSQRWGVTLGKLCEDGKIPQISRPIRFWPRIFITQIFGPDIWLPKVIRVIEGKRGKTPIVLENFGIISGSGILRFTTSSQMTKNKTTLWKIDSYWCYHWLSSPFLDFTDVLWLGHLWSKRYTQNNYWWVATHMPHETY